MTATVFLKGDFWPLALFLSLWFISLTALLNESLTNIQWLCGLESDELLDTEKEKPWAHKEPSPRNPFPKPPYSYATLILMAINSTEEKRMTLQEIYKWIETNYPFYKTCKKAWKVFSRAILL